jgi:murein DD-endopeptidase MepM/ murein hydrolase activator NlpD
MPKLKDQQDSDSQYDPYSNEYARDLLRQDTETGKDAGVNAGVDQAEAFANDPKNASAAIQATDRAEQVPNEYNWDETDKARSAKPKTIRARLTGLAKKRGATFAIGGGLLGFGTFITIFLSPSLLLMQMADVLNESFNDQLAALDARSTLIMKKKLNTQVTKGVCGTKITIKCKYRTISKNQTARLKAAGLVPINDSGEIEGRGKPKAFRYQGREISAGQLLNEARNDPGVRSALRKGYNPSFAAWADANAFKMLERFGIKKSSSVDPSGDREKMREQLKKVAQGDVAAFGDKKLIGKDKDGNTVPDAEADYFETDDEDKIRYDGRDGRSINNLIQQSIDRGGLAKTIGKTALKSGVKSVLTSTALGAGAVDTLCTAWTVVRVAGFAAKIYQQQQLIRYAYEFQKQADMVRAGDGKAELSTFFNDIVTSTNANGKAATDSAGYLWAAFGDTFKPDSFNIAQEKFSEQEAEAQSAKIELQNETSRYVNGQLISTSMMAQLANNVKSGAGVEAADSTCKFVKSWKGQALIIGAAVAGAIAAFFSGGASLGPGVILNGAASLTISVIFALLQPKLIDMAKGEVIKGDENGNEAGNAIVSGSGAINAQASQTRGLPAQTIEDHVAYNELSREVAADYAEVDRYERNPLDATSKNTFLGSIMATIVPYVSKSRTVGTGVLNMSSMVLGTVSSFGVSKAGADDMSAQQLSQCDDFEYGNIADKKLAADPFCNLRYGMSPEDLAIDPERVVDYMVKGGYIVADDDPTAAPGSEYEDYIKKCIERETSIGDGQTSLDGSTGGGEGYDGAMCIDGNSGADEERNTMFRLFYIDTTVDEGMEGTFDVSTEQAITGGSQFVVATLNVWGYSHSMGNYKERMDASIENLQSNNTDIAGLQEFQKPQREYFLKQVGSTFDISPKTADYDGHLGENPIVWNSTRFELVEDGVMPNLKYFDGSTLRVPWVKLKDISTQQEFYVLNTHDPAKPENAIYRFQNADQHVEYIKSLASEGLPIVFTGDFNSGFEVRTSNNTTYQGKSENLTYCILTKDGVMNNTFDLQEGRDVKCPNPGNENSVDHIYVSPDIQLTKYWKTTNRGADGNGSDSHDTHFADLTIPGGTVSSGAGSTFIIGTYNQKRALSVAQHEGAMDNIVDKKMDVVGTQETSNPKFTRYKEYLGKRNYGVFPTALPQQVNQTCAGSQAIFYNKAKFNFVKGDFIQYPRYPGKAAECGAGESSKAGPSSQNGLPDVWTNTPVAWLRDTVTGQTVIVINTHGVANVQLAGGTEPAKSRYVSAQIYVENIKRLKTENPGIPIFFTGDFNEGTNVRDSGNRTYQGKQENLLFCMLAKEKLMVSAAGPAMECNPKYNIGIVDYIYTTPEVKTDWVKEIANGGSNSGAPSYTDHPVKYAQVTVPGSGSGAASGGWVWPTIGPITNGNCYNVPVSELGTHAGMDINTPVNNLKVVAMSDGVVVQKNYGSASGNYIMIKAADGTYYAYQHLKSTPTVSGAVKAGQEIGIAGKTGRVFLQSSQGHLHITMARTATLGSYGGHPDNFDPMDKLKAVKPANYNCTR